MNSTTLITIGFIIVLAIGAFFILNYFRKKNQEQLFAQVFETSRQVPKQKKNSFLLLMFKESLVQSKRKSKKKSAAISGNLNNPKYLEVQLIQMGNILKDPSKAKDKTIKRALFLLKEYYAWEKKKNPRNKEVSTTKAS